MCSTQFPLHHSSGEHKQSPDMLASLPTELLACILDFDNVYGCVFNLWYCGNSLLNLKLANGGCTRLIFEVLTLHLIPSFVVRLQRLLHLCVDAPCSRLSREATHCIFSHHRDKLQSLQLNTRVDDLGDWLHDLNTVFPRLKHLLLGRRSEPVFWDDFELLTAPPLIDYTKLPQELEHLTVRGTLMPFLLKPGVKILPRTLKSLQICFPWAGFDRGGHWRSPMYSFNGYRTLMKDLPPALTTLNIVPSVWLQDEGLAGQMKLLPKTITSLPINFSLFPDLTLPEGLKRLSLNGFPSDPTLWNTMQLPCLTELEVNMVHNNREVHMRLEDLAHLPPSLTGLSIRSEFALNRHYDSDDIGEEYREREPWLELSFPTSSSATSSSTPTTVLPLLRQLTIEPSFFPDFRHLQLPSLQTLDFVLSSRSDVNFSFPHGLTELRLRFERGRTEGCLLSREQLASLPSSLTKLCGVRLSSTHLFGHLPRGLKYLEMDLLNDPPPNNAFPTVRLPQCTHQQPETHIDLPRSLIKLTITHYTEPSARDEDVWGNMTALHHGIRGASHLKLIECLPRSLVSLCWILARDNDPLREQHVRALPATLTSLQAHIEAPGVAALSEQLPLLTDLSLNSMCPASIPSLPQHLRHLYTATFSPTIPTKDELTLLPSSLKSFHCGHLRYPAMLSRSARAYVYQRFLARDQWPLNDGLDDFDQIDQGKGAEHDS